MPVYAENKRAKFDYEILEKLEAGLVLTGQEVKSIRAGHGKLTGAFVTFHGTEARLTNFHLPPYRYASHLEGYDPEQSRRVLLKKKQIDYLRGKALADGLTMVPLSLYTSGRRIKMEIGLCKGRKKYDKREAIKKKDIQKELRRAVSNI